MGKVWADQSMAARAVFAEADDVLGDRLGAPLSQLCFEGPPERLNQTDVSQPAIYVCSVASWRGLCERGGDDENTTFADEAIVQAAGLSLGEYTALHLAGVFSFADGLRVVAERGRLMQEAAEASGGGMVALIGADEIQAAELCQKAVEQGDVLVCANFNAPGQIVLSGHKSACDRAVELAGERGLRATPLAVAGAFHSPLMGPAAEKMGEVLAQTPMERLQCPVWANVTAQPHDSDNLELLRELLVKQITEPVCWSQSCQSMAGAGTINCHELAPGSVLRGLMRRIDRTVKVVNHDQP